MEYSFCISILIGLFLISQAQSLTCSSQFFPNRSFAHCEDLPHLDAFLHWNYNPQNSYLSIAFLARPPHSSGWVAWAVNPTGTGMIGAQALFATFSAGSPTVLTFNISSYSSILPSALSFPVWDLAAIFCGGRFTIFATMEVPAKAKSLNHVWQVGQPADPESGASAAHEYKLDNLNAKSVLVFDKDRGVNLVSPAPAAVVVKELSTVASAHAGVTTRNLGFFAGFFSVYLGDY